MDISKMDKAKVLAALYNNAKPQGLGFLLADSREMTTGEAQEILNTGQTYFDYLKGRVMKVDLSKDDLWTALYNRDNGNNAAELAIAGAE